MDRDKVQGEALSALKKSDGGTVVMSPGTGKTKVAIDFLKYMKPKKVLITSPRTNLKENWKKELEKWNISTMTSGAEGSNEYEFYHYNGGKYDKLEIHIVNIQTCYKWDETKLNEFDLIIADEIHTMVTPEYGNLFEIANLICIPIIGLTGTPDDRKLDKNLFYAKYCPIVYRYLDSAKDGIINKRKYIIYEHRLDNIHEVLVGTKTKKWMSGEKKQYEYIQSNIDNAESTIKEFMKEPLIDELRGLRAVENPTPMISRMIDVKQRELDSLDESDYYVNYYSKANSWKTSNDRAKSKVAWQWLRNITARQELLWNLTSTAVLAQLMCEDILETIKDSKVLVFSERTGQASQISKVVVHSKNKKEVNDKNLNDFNKGKIRQLGSCYSLTLGLNMDNAGYAIMESYNGSDVQFAQRSGRVDRLPVDDNAIVIMIVVKDTQAETWFNRAVKFTDDDVVKTVDNILDFKETLKEFKSCKNN